MMQQSVWQIKLWPCLDAIRTVKVVATKHRLNADFLQRVGIMAKKAAPHYKPPDCKRMPRPPDAKSKRSWLKTPEIRGRSPQAKASGRKDVHRSRSPMRAGESSVGRRQRSPSQPKRRSPPKSEARSSRDAVVLKPRSDDDDQREGRKDKPTDDPWIWKMGSCRNV